MCLLAAVDQVMNGSGPLAGRCSACWANNALSNEPIRRILIGADCGPPFTVSLSFHS